jgi:hypothetical protein
MGKRSGHPHTRTEFENLTRAELEAVIKELKLRIKFMQGKTKKTAERKLVAVEAIRGHRFPAATGGRQSSRSKKQATV